MSSGECAQVSRMTVARRSRVRGGTPNSSDANDDDEGRKCLELKETQNPP